MNDGEKIGDALRVVAKAITPLDALPFVSPIGGRVGSLTEALIYIGDQLGRVADAIEDRNE